MRRLVLAASLLSIVPGASFVTYAAVEIEYAQAPRDGAELGSRLAAGPIVVLATAIRVGAKQRFRVERIYRGSAVSEVVRIDARQSNARRVINSPAFDAERDERAIFVLAPARDYRDALRGGQIYEPADGFRSKIPIPAEGAPALFDAVERVIDFQDSPERGVVEARLVQWLEGRNPWLVDFALDQAARFGVAGPPWVPGLMTLTRAADPWRRVRAVEALGSALSRNRLESRRPLRRGSPLAAQEANDALRASREALVRLARTDEDPEVRIAAVRAVPRSGHAEAARVLEVISRDDPSQDVRYEAAASLERLRNGRGRAGAAR